MTASPETTHALTEQAGESESVVAEDETQPTAAMELLSLSSASPPAVAPVPSSSSSSFAQSLRRDLNCLSDPDRAGRCRALEKLRKCLTMPANLPSLDVLQDAWDCVLCPPILKTFHDHVEKCRTIAINITISIIHHLSDVDKTTGLVIPTAVEMIGKFPMNEPSEEIRLSLLRLIKCLVSRCSSKILATNLDFIAQILAVSSSDPFHEIKKETCDVVALTVSRNENVPSSISEKLFKAILPNIAHPHCKVRMAVLRGINAIVRCNFTNDVIMDLLIPSVRELAFDQIEKVRKMFFDSIAAWLDCGLNDSLSSDILKKRVPELLSLLLVGIFDVSSDIGLATLSLVEDIGRRYEQMCEASSLVLDNTDGFKYKRKNSSEYERVNPHNTIEQYLTILPAPFKRRPDLGCCKLVQDFINELLDPVIKGLREWTQTARCGAARLLHALLIMAEEQASACLDVLIRTMCSAVGDDNVHIAQSIVGASHILGWHVEPDCWLQLLLPQIECPGTTPIQVANSLVVCSGLLHGTQNNVVNENVVIQVVQHLSQMNLEFKQFAAIQNQTLGVITNIIASAGPHCAACSCDVLHILIQLQSFGSDTVFNQDVMQTEERLAKSIGFSSAKELYRNNVECLLRMVITDHENWSADSCRQLIFQTLMQKVGDMIGEFMHLLLPTLKTCLSMDQDSALRIRILQILDELFEIPELASSWSQHALTILDQILVPCGVWHVGKVGAAIRHAAMVAICTFLRRGLCSQEVLQTVLLSDQSLPIILSCFEEDYYVDIRIVSCHVLENILLIAGKVLSDNMREEIRKALEERLDDSSDDVRMRVLSAISAFLRTVPTSYTDASVSSMINNLILHMDDDSCQIQEAVYHSLEICTTLRPVIVEEAILKNIRGQQKTREYCDHLLTRARTQNLKER